MRVSELTNGRELRTLRDGDAMNGGTPQVWDLSAPIPNIDRGKESFSELANFPEVPGGGPSVYIYMPDIDCDDRAARAHYVRSLPLYTMETQRVQLCMQQKLHDLEIA